MSTGETPKKEEPAKGAEAGNADDLGLISKILCINYRKNHLFGDERENPDPDEAPKAEPLRPSLQRPSSADPVRKDTMSSVVQKDKKK